MTKNTSGRLYKTKVFLLSFPSRFVLILNPLITRNRREIIYAHKQLQPHAKKTTGSTTCKGRSSIVHDHSLHYCCSQTSCSQVYIPDDGFAAEWSRSIVSGLIMHKTSAEMYTVCDTNGWGLINGNILRIATVNSPTSVVVEYIPFEQIETQKADNSSCLYGIITDLGGSNQQWRVEVYESLATLQSALGQQDDIEHLFRPVAVLGKELNSEL